MQAMHIKTYKSVNTEISDLGIRMLTPQLIPMVSSIVLFVLELFILCSDR
jgi:hypothetical protein